MINIPDEIFTQPALHLRACTSAYLHETCPQHVPENVARKCRMYYAPVEDSSGVAFKNIYCAICNGTSQSTLTCRKTSYEVISFSKVSHPLNSAAVVRSVEVTPTCVAEYNGRCYINQDTDVKRLYQARNLDGSSTSLPASHGEEVQFSRSDDVEHYLTVIWISLSISCLLLKNIIFCVYKKSRSFTAKCTLCLAFTLVLTHLVFLITKCASLPSTGCVVGGVLVHYGFLSTFFWTSALSYDIYKSLTTIELSSTRDSRLAAYGLYSWGSPLVITVIAVTVDRTLPGTVLSPSYGHPFCWIGSFWSLILYFLIPVAVLMLFCLLFYFKSVSYIRQTSSAVDSARKEQEPSELEEVRSTKQRNHAVLFVRLAMIMCAPWPVAFVGTLIESKTIDCIVNILVGLQGVYLFFAFKDYRFFFSSCRSGTFESPA
ncbi:putative G-protein coupled receptor Mth-like 4 [Amblyomma americanum]